MWCPGSGSPKRRADVGGRGLWSRGKAAKVGTCWRVTCQPIVPAQWRVSVTFLPFLARNSTNVVVYFCGAVDIQTIWNRIVGAMMSDEWENVWTEAVMYHRGAI
jgi:hypothetical protein